MFAKNWVASGVLVVWSLMMSATALANAEKSTFVVIDPAVTDWQEMVAALPESVETLVLSDNQEPFGQILEALQSSDASYGALHVISHASAGVLNLANHEVSLANIREVQPLMQQMASHFAETADLVFYGCDLAADEQGRELLAIIAESTQLDILASTDKTGSAQLGGDWDFEYSLGETESRMLFARAFAENYSAVLSHFRGGSITWRAVALDGDSQYNDVEITIKTAWRYNSISAPSLQATPTLTLTKTTDVTDYINGDSSGADYALRTATYTAKDLDPDTSYLVYDTNCCRISNLQNNADGDWKIQTTIYMSGGNLAPKIDLPIIYEVPMLESDGVTVLESYSFGIGSTDPNADKIRFRLANLDELGGGASTNPEGFSIDSNTGYVTWNNSGSLSPGLYSAGIVVEDVDSGGNVKSKSHADFILELINKPAVAYTPSANIPESRNIIVEKGETFDFSITGVAVDVSSLGDIQGSLTETSEGAFTFDPGAVGSGLDPGTYPITFEIYDTSGASTKSYLILNFIVPDPNAPKIINIEGDTTVYSDTSSPRVDVDQDAVVSDLDNAGDPVNDLNNGYIRFNVSFTDGQYEVLDLESVGDAAGEIRRDGYEVFYEGSKIADIDPFEDGVGNALRLDFGTASLEAVQAVVRSLTYTDTFVLRTVSKRNLSLYIEDADGLARNYSLYIDVEDHPSKPANGSPVEVTNVLSLDNGDTVTISSDNISFADADHAAADLAISVTGLSNGQFELAASPGTPISSFTQEQVNQGQLQFVHDGSGSAPAYSLTVSDGTNTLGPNAAAISFSNSGSDAVSVYENSRGVSMVTSDNVTGTASYAITGSAADNSLFSVNASSGSLSFDSAPDFESPADANGDNIYEVEVTVTGSTSGTDVRAITVSLLNINEAPSISGSPATTVAEMASYNFTPGVIDPDTASLSFSIVNKPAWASFNSSTGELSGTPDYTNAGSYTNIVISVDDGGNSVSLPAFAITVTDVNAPPTISGTPQTTVAENGSYSFTPTGSDIDSGEVLTYSILNKPDWAAFDTATGALSGSPGYDDAGSYSGIVISLADDDLASDSLAAFTITVTNSNRAPAISGTPAVVAAENNPYSFVPTASDPDSADILSYSIINKPDWASFDTATGALTGTPGYDDAGSYSGIVISVSDGQGGSDSLTAFDITVSNTNRAPVISGTPVGSVAENSAYSFTPGASDADSGSLLSFTIINKPAWASFNTVSGALTGTPGYDDAGSYSGIVISVSDGQGGSDSLSAFDITVSNTNRAPSISGVPQSSVAEASGYSFVPVANDPDSAAVLSYSIANKPSWASFNTSTGGLSGTPGYNDAGSYPGIVITVSDGEGGSDSLAAFTITVSNTNRAPSLSGVPASSAVEMSPYSFTPLVTDPDSDDTLQFSITNKPSWASFNTATGALTGTPQDGDASSNAGIVISVSDGKGGFSSLPAFSIVVSNDNTAPVANAQSLVAVENVSVAITLSGSDSDGNILTFSVVTAPAHGSLTGNAPNLIYTPSSDYIGLDSFTFRANDGDLNSAIANVTINVQEDLDGDQVADTDDSDTDGDGIPDAVEGESDSDGDGIPDNRDSDSDNDGIPDSEEGAADSDNDGIPDYLDPDSDNDGLSDEQEGTGDSDGDGIPDRLDSSLDEDRDGIPDIIEGTGDTDGDGIPDFLDPDSDNDGLLDSRESGITGSDTDGDGIDDRFDVDQTGGVDLDEDGIDDTVALRDSDDDGVPDMLDPDSDGDGVPDKLESSKTLPDSDGDGIADVYDADNTGGSDSDADGIDDRFDADQTGGWDADNDGLDDARIIEPDTDRDGIPDYLDTDSDNDGISDRIEAGVSGVDSDNDGIDDSYDVDTTGGSDSDGDGIDDAAVLLDSDADGIADLYDLDADNDGILDVDEAGYPDLDRNGQVDDQSLVDAAPMDSDGDGIYDFRDLDSDNDGINDIDGNAAHVLDEDGDGRIDTIVDDDADGIHNLLDQQPGSFGTREDSDNDNVPAGLDQDQDNDGIADSVEGTGDSDGDGLMDALDRDSDNDGLPDMFESDRPIPLGLDTDLDGIDDAYDVDATGGLDNNNDGIDDNYTEPDTDADGIPDYLDADSDNDGIPDSEEQLLVGLSGNDSDGDGIDDAVDVDTTGGSDRDGDGIDDRVMKTLDFDNDGLPDYRDTDSDNDGVPDGLENADYNGDGIIDRLQTDSGVDTGINGGGGAFNALYLLALLWLLAARLRLGRNLLAVAILMAPLSRVYAESCDYSSAYAQPGCWYLGASLGASKLEPEPNSDSSWRLSDGRDRAVGVFAGLRLSDQVFAELSYLDLGEARLASLNPNITERPSIDYAILGVSGGYWLRPYSSEWNAFVKLGLQTLDTSSTAYSEQNKTTQVTAGAGVQWQFHEKWFARFTVETFDKDAQAATFAIARYLGSSSAKTPRKITETATTPVTVAPVAPADSDKDGVVDEMDQCPNSAAGASVNSQGCAMLESLTLDVQFASGSSELLAEHTQRLDALVEKIAVYGNSLVITVAGHTDWTGKESVNQSLSEARAQAVADYMQTHLGVPVENYRVIGFGEMQPIADNNTAEGRLRNRRVVIDISS